MPGKLPGICHLYCQLSIMLLRICTALLAAPFLTWSPQRSPKNLRFSGGPDGMGSCPDEPVKTLRRTAGGLVLRRVYCPFASSWRI